MPARQQRDKYIAPQLASWALFRKPQFAKQHGQYACAAEAETAARARAHDLRRCPRHITIVTTASLPWMTGTAVNPALRAVALAADGHSVTLVVPWLDSVAEQCRVYGGERTYSSQHEQASQVRQWLEAQEEAGKYVDVEFYDGVYSVEMGSILPCCDLPALLTSEYKRTLDVVILEEPEHLCWFHAGKAWTEIADLVVGVVHTNYLEYIFKSGGAFGLNVLQAGMLSLLNLWVTTAHCHRVIRLSAAVQRLPSAVTCNTHGVRQQFLDIGASLARKNNSHSRSPFTKGAYFLGKVLWTKGFQELFYLLERSVADGGEPQEVDLFGSGPDLEAVRARVRSRKALRKVKVFGRVQDHATAVHEYQVFVNCSQSDVVCTATAEAIAMGKNVVLLRHPSNEFFRRFRNARFYSTPRQFTEALFESLRCPPMPLSAWELNQLSWKAATQRFYDAVLLDSAPKHWPWISSALAAAHRAGCHAYDAVIKSPASHLVQQRKALRLVEDRHLE